MRKMTMGFADAFAITGLTSFTAEFRDLGASGGWAGLEHLMSGYDETSAVENRKVVIAVAASRPGQRTFLRTEICGSARARVQLVPCLLGGMRAMKSVLAESGLLRHTPLPSAANALLTLIQPVDAARGADLHGKRSWGS
jgi:hypothetical protein